MPWVGDSDNEPLQEVKVQVKREEPETTRAEIINLTK
jgi:hypothetical protein